MKKIKAYTLMEVTIAMLLSAICISVCYTAYGIISKYYQTFQEKNETAEALLSLKHVMERDFIKSTCILAVDSGLEMQQGAGMIRYRFSPQRIVREVTDLHADTFKMECEGVKFLFEGNPVLAVDTIDRVDMTIVKGKALRVHLRIDKKYSAQDLLN